MGPFPLVAGQLSGSRQPIVDAVVGLGYSCEPEESSAVGPRIFCLLPSAEKGEFVAILGAAEDFHEVAVVSQSLDRAKAFVGRFGTVELAETFSDQLKGLAEWAAQPDTQCPLPCTLGMSGQDYGPVWIQLAAIDFDLYGVSLAGAPS
jgi:hypothetical protein